MARLLEKVAISYVDGGVKRQLRGLDGLPLMATVFPEGCLDAIGENIISIYRCGKRVIPDICVYYMKDGSAYLEDTISGETYYYASDEFNRCLSVAKSRAEKYDSGAVVAYPRRRVTKRAQK